MDYRKLGLGLAAFAVGATAWVVGVSKFGPVGKRARVKPVMRDRPNPAAEHVPTDLMGDRRPAATDRAPLAFRPDPTAIPTAEEREALRPATGHAPSFAADRGSAFADATGAA